MPLRQPYAFQGRVFDTNGSTVVEGATVTAFDRQANDSVSGETDSNGKYIIDLANMTAAYTPADNINLEAKKGNRILRYATTVLGAGSEDHDFTLEYDDALGAVLDLLSDNWRKENTDNIFPVIDFIFNRKQQDLDNNDFILAYELQETDDPFGLQGESNTFRFQEITGLSLDVRTTKKVAVFSEVRIHTTNIRQEIKRILKANMAAPHLPFQLLIPRRVKDLSDKSTGMGRVVFDYDIKYWGA